jgi:hypothetical protein
VGRDEEGGTRRAERGGRSEEDGARRAEPGRMRGAEGRGRWEVGRSEGAGEREREERSECERSGVSERTRFGPHTGGRIPLNQGRRGNPSLPRCLPASLPLSSTSGRLPRRLCSSDQGDHSIP